MLHADGEDLLDAPLSRRSEVLSDLVTEPQRVPRLITAELDEARSFADRALTEGHEGIVVKAIEAP